jgi:hypothetical protein
MTGKGEGTERWSRRRVLIAIGAIQLLLLSPAILLRVFLVTLPASSAFITGIVFATIPQFAALSILLNVYKLILMNELEKEAFFRFFEAQPFLTALEYLILLGFLGF